MDDTRSALRMEMGDGLDTYMAAADEIAATLLTSDDPLVAALRRYDAYMRSDLWAHVSRAEPIGFLLQMNAYMGFLAGARMALSGHPAAVFPLLRTALESASFGLLIERSPALANVWAHRHQGEAEHRACRKAFNFAKGVAHLREMAPQIFDLANLAYEGAIDFGAHPNPKGVVGHVSINEGRPDGMTAITLTSLYGASHVETIRGLCACLDFGLAIIGIIALSAPSPGEGVAEELQGLSDLKNEATAPYQAPA